MCRYHSCFALFRWMFKMKKAENCRDESNNSAYWVCVSSPGLRNWNSRQVLQTCLVWNELCLPVVRAVCQETIWEAFKIFWDRLPEQDEYQSWMSQCQDSAVTAHQIGSFFSQSVEHQALVKKVCGWIMDEEHICQNTAPTFLLSVSRGCRSRVWKCKKTLFTATISITHLQSHH